MLSWGFARPFNVLDMMVSKRWHSIGHHNVHNVASREECLIFRSDSNGEDLEGFAGAGLFESVCSTSGSHRHVTSFFVPVNPAKQSPVKLVVFQGLTSLAWSSSIVSGSWRSEAQYCTDLHSMRLLELPVVTVVVLRNPFISDHLRFCLRTKAIVGNPKRTKQDVHSCCDSCATYNVWGDSLPMARCVARGQNLLTKLAEAGRHVEKAFGGQPQAGDARHCQHDQHVFGEFHGLVHDDSIYFDILGYI